MRVCDYIAQQLSLCGIKRVYGLMGGGAAGLNDGFISHPSIDYICFHHEQGAGHAATGESKYTGQLSVVNPTTGCGGTNCITSVINAWQDSLPVLFVSGNVRLDQTSRYINTTKNISIRKYGIQEHDIIETVRSTTKYAKMVTNIDEVADVLERAISTALTPRRGPVWIDIPADIQTQVYQTAPRNIHPYTVADLNAINLPDYESLVRRIKNANRPLVLAGQGIYQAGAGTKFIEFIENFNIPCVYTYGGSDLLPYSHPLSVGAIGVKGSRAGNFAMQHSDLLFILGCSLNVSHIGYDKNNFAKNAYKIVVDIDTNELKKDITFINKKILCDLNEFLTEMRSVPV